MDRLPPLRLLTTFEEVARLGSMREAAERLNVTRPAITHAIHQLEAHVGTPLLDRGRRPARLTEAGELLARATRDGLAQIQGAIDAIRLASAARGDQVTVACTFGMATYWLMPRLPAFYAAHPAITVNVQAPPRDLPVRGPDIDLALRYGSGDWSDGLTVKLFDEVMTPVGQPALVTALVARGVRLAEAPLIHVRSSANSHWAGWGDYLRRSGAGRLSPGGQTFDNYVQATQAAMNGLGVMLGWRSISGRLVAEGSLRPWPAAAIPAGAGYYLTSAAMPSRAAVVLRDWLLAEGLGTD